ncbi:MAG TPA: DUF882 domain-containing protein [Nitrospiraceae bacterium]|nr:DUF882 domain-containing protein [Nitrospiraceae bacterium]
MDNPNESNWVWTRRTLLRTALAGCAMLGARLLCPPVTVARALPEGQLTLVNLWTDERLEVTYRNEAGEYDLDALDDVNHILRCHYTGEVAAIDVRVLEHVNLVQKKLGGDREIHIISGFRSPEYNAMLVRSGRRAARNSLHVQGQAIDLQIPGIHPKMVRQAALELGYGGVGYYPRSKFVHLDSGPFRQWYGGSRSHHKIARGR